MPELDRCCACGKIAPSGEMLRYSRKEGGMLCGDCSGGAGQGFGLVDAGPGCRRWLETVRPLRGDQTARFTLDAKSFAEAKALATAILSEAVGRRLASWDW
jgi:recombinational DNA repair protein (RecF pathway)